MKILIACEESQTVCKAFRKKGHEAYSNDIIDCSGGHPEWHLKMDCFEAIKLFAWDMMIAFPPCTYISRAGARWMYPSAGIVCEERLELAIKAKKFFMGIFNAPIERIAIENPLPLKIVGLPIHTQVVQPYQFGHPYSKRTHLWLKNLPLLLETNMVDNFKPFLRSNTGYGKSKGQRSSKGAVYGSKKASKTFQGIANAMADQWDFKSTI